MNKKIILLLVIACIISAIAFKTFAGTAGGSGLVGPICSAGPTATPGSIATASASITTAGFSTTTITLNTSTGNFTLGSGGLNIQNDTVLKSCDGYTDEYLAQNITGNWTNVSFVQVSAASPHTLLAVLNDGYTLLNAEFASDNSIENQALYIPNFEIVEMDFLRDANNQEKIYKTQITLKYGEVYVGISAADHPVVGFNVVGANGEILTTTIREFSDLTIGAGGSVSLATPVTIATGKEGTVSDNVAVAVNVNTGGVADAEAYILGFNIDWNVDAVTVDYGDRATLFASDGNDVSISSAVPLPLPSQEELGVGTIVPMTFMAKLARIYWWLKDSQMRYLLII